MTRSQARRFILLAVYLIVVAALFVVLVVSAEYFELAGWTTGVEYSPDLFVHRSFRYYTVLGIRLTPKRTETWMSPVDEYLHRNGFVDATASSQPRWRLVKAYAPGVRGWSGDAKWMCMGLGCWAGSDRWVKWSEQHPELAKRLWPHVVDRVRRERYDEVYYLFRMTSLEKATTPEDIDAKLRKAEELAHR